MSPIGATGPKSAPAQMTGFNQPMISQFSPGFASSGFSPIPNVEDFTNIVVPTEGGSAHASPEMLQPEA